MPSVWQVFPPWLVGRELVLACVVSLGDGATCSFLMVSPWPQVLSSHCALVITQMRPLCRSPEHAGSLPHLPPSEVLLEVLLYLVLGSLMTLALGIVIVLLLSFGDL